MKLSFEKIKEITFGTVSIEQTQEGIEVTRFTPAQLEAYKGHNMKSYKRALTAAGIRMEFSTTGSKLIIEGECAPGTVKSQFSFDVYLNGHPVAHTTDQLVDGYVPFKVEADLGEGENKRVTVYFPWNAKTRLHRVEIDDGATVTPIYRPFKMICFGDSITHGQNAVYPSFTYASRLADALNADMINKGIGAEIFFPEVAALKDDYDPQIITVAYGTNDWAKLTAEKFNENSLLFFKNLAQSYPDAKIFALTPIWRQDCESRITDVGDFHNVAKKLRSIAEDIPNVTVIDCFNFVPHRPDCFAPDGCHPNDEGFRHYAYNLYAEIKKYLG